MKVILDGVFNHCGSFNKWLDREGFYAASGEYAPGAYQSKESPYRNFFKFRNENDKNSYEGWWGYETLPKLNFEESEELCEYICRVGAKWVSAPYNVDGWRLDVADELPDCFIKQIRCAVKRNGGVLYGEVWEDASNKVSYGEQRAFLYGEELDSVMNYPFLNAIHSFVKGGSGVSFMQEVLTICENYPKETIDCLMNLLSTHDTERVLTALAGEESLSRGREWQAVRGACEKRPPRH